MDRRDLMSYFIFVAVAILIPVLAVVIDMIAAGATHIWLVIVSIIWMGTGIIIGMGFLK